MSEFMAGYSRGYADAVFLRNEEISSIKPLRDRIKTLERALREIIEQDDVGDVMYRKDGPCAVMARIALEAGKNE